MMAYKIIDRTADLNALERDVKNKFQWSWLEEKDAIYWYLPKWIGNIFVNN
jgi:hypothetical protein